MWSGAGGRSRSIGARCRRTVTGDRAAGRSFVMCGRPMPGYAVEIRDSQNMPQPERIIGRVCIKGPSLMAGYFRNDVATHGVLQENGWLDTGDMGYLVDGQLVITGRSKDLIIVGGRNIWPQDLEWAVEHLEGVRAGDAAAFAVNRDDDSERWWPWCNAVRPRPRHRTSCARPWRVPCGALRASSATWSWHRRAR